MPMSICKRKETSQEIHEPRHPKTLEELVRKYLSHKNANPAFPDMGEKTDQEWHDVYLSSLDDMTDFICGERNSTKAPHGSKYRLNTHQWSFGFPRRKHIVNVMAEKLSGIDELEFDSFEDLIEYVHSCKEKFFGHTAIYDFALRYGWNHDPQIKPEKFVYVHTKPWESAKHLIKEGYLSEIKKLRRQLPLEKYKELLLPGMTAHDVEHFLCVYHDEIKKL